MDKEKGEKCHLYVNFVPFLKCYRHRVQLAFRKGKKSLDENILFFQPA